MRSRRLAPPTGHARLQISWAPLATALSTDVHLRIKGRIETYHPHHLTLSIATHQQETWEEHRPGCTPSDGLSSAPLAN